MSTRVGVSFMPPSCGDDVMQSQYRDQEAGGRNPSSGPRPPVEHVSRYEDLAKTRSCVHTVGGRGLGTPLCCPVPAVAAEAAIMARLTTTWTKPDEPGLGFFLLMVSLLGVSGGGRSAPVDGHQTLMPWCHMCSPRRRQEIAPSRTGIGPSKSR